jgi:5-methylthioadenosine/S-adenosylhomocysteine deaminase
MGDHDNSGSDRATADILVLGGIVVTMDDRRTILPEGALALRGDSILALGPRAQIAAVHSAATIIDATGCLVIPGLIDAHTHIPMTLFRGLADDLPLHTWLEQHVWPAEHRFINAETVRWASRLGVAELLRSGVTTLCDMYFYEDEVAAAVDELGMRGVLANAHFDVTSASNTERERTLAEAEQFVTRWRGHPRIVPALGPHAPYTVAPELYRRLHALAERLDTLVVTHLAETRMRTATSAASMVARPSATWRTSASWTTGWSLPTVSGSTVRRSISWQRPARGWCTTRAAT